MPEERICGFEAMPIRFRHNRNGNCRKRNPRIAAVLLQETYLPRRKHRQPLDEVRPVPETPSSRSKIYPVLKSPELQPILTAGWSYKFRVKSCKLGVVSSISRSWKSKSNRGMDFVLLSRSWKSKSNRGSFVSIFWFQLLTLNSQLQPTPPSTQFSKIDIKTLRNFHSKRVSPRKFPEERTSCLLRRSTVDSAFCGCPDN